jgi:hypothetical protein
MAWLILNLSIMLHMRTTCENTETRTPKLITKLITTVNCDLLCMTIHCESVQVRIIQRPRTVLLRNSCVRVLLLSPVQKRLT